MKRLLFCGFLALGACGTAGDNGVGSGGSSPIVGKWLSAGGDVAPLLTALHFTQVTAQFNDNGSYVVHALTDQGQDTELDGTFVDTASSVNGIYNITVHQTAPSTLESDGIYEVDGTGAPVRMQYEVVQTQPTQGWQPPSATKGFGSTITDKGTPTQINIQKYVRQ
jgi:hypothetical protein